MKAGTKSVYSAFPHFPDTKLRSRSEVLQELARPAGRFMVPKEAENSLASFISEKLRPIDPLGSGQIFAGSGIPLQWQALARYLKRKKIIVESGFGFIPQENDLPKLASVRFTLDHTARPTDGRTTTNTAFGAGFSAEEAMAKACGEALERYFLSTYRRADFLEASYATLASKRRSVLDLHALNTFNAAQRAALPKLDWSDDSPLRWVQGNAYPSRKKILLPAQLVFWNYLHQHEGGTEHMLARATTSGCAGGFSMDEAVLAGLLELIERDSFLIFWLNQLAPPILDVASLKDPRTEEFLAYFERYRLRPIFLDTTTDLGVPAITCVLINNATPGGPIISIGAEAGFDLPDMLIHSAIEALSTSSFARSSPPFELPHSYEPFRDQTIDREKRLRLWRGTIMADRFAFFLSGKRQDPQPLMRICERHATHDAQLRYVLDALGRLGAGYEVFIYEARDAVLKELGFHAVRTIVPQLVPLYLSEYAAPLDAQRLREVPAKLGLRPAETLNPWPHPFP